MRHAKIVILSILVLFITSFKSSSQNGGEDHPNLTDSQNDLKTPTKVAEKQQKISYTWDNLIQRIKKREGLVLEPYHCAGGYLTIGYGHLMTERDSVLLNGITEQQADSLLRHDLNYSKRWVKANLKLKGTKLIAITNFCFAFGTSKLYRSTLYKKVQNGEAIDEEIMRWVNINGRPSNYLKKEREFELWLYTLNDKPEPQENILTNFSKGSQLKLNESQSEQTAQ